MIVNWLRQMKQKNINDCIYANYMNLNKTWMMIVFCITINFICERFSIFLLQKFFRLFNCYFLDFIKNFHNWFVYHWRENLSQLFCLLLTRKSFTIALFIIDAKIFHNIFHWSFNNFSTNAINSFDIYENQFVLF